MCLTGSTLEILVGGNRQTLKLESNGITFPAADLGKNLQSICYYNLKRTKKILKLHNWVFLVQWKDLGFSHLTQLRKLISKNPTNSANWNEPSHHFSYPISQSHGAHLSFFFFFSPIFTHSGWVIHCLTIVSDSCFSWTESWIQNPKVIFRCSRSSTPRWWCAFRDAFVLTTFVKSGYLRYYSLPL